MYLLLANIVLGLHVLIVFFVVFSVPAIFVGAYFKWNVIRNFWFRVSHLVCISIVALQSWFGIVCPLTTLEMWLRKKANVQVYEGSFIEHWMQTFLYWDFPTWVFIVIYSLFVLLVSFTWIFVPPKKAIN